MINFDTGMQFPISFIARELSLSSRSVYNAVKKYELSYTHADITDDQVDVIVTSVLEKWPTTGELEQFYFNLSYHYIIFFAT
jgi:hypothetical protein